MTKIFLEQGKREGYTCTRYKYSKMFVFFLSDIIPQFHRFYTYTINVNCLY